MTSRGEDGVEVGRPVSDRGVRTPWWGGGRGDEWFSGRLGRFRAGLLAVGLVGALVAVWSGISADQLRGNASVRNGAVADAAATATVVRQVSDAVAAAFSYDYNDTGKTEQAAARFLSGSAVQQYTALFGQVKQLAPGQKAMLSTTVRSVGVTDLHGDEATALVLVDQQVVRGDTNQHGSGAAQLTVHVQRFGPIWKITEITFL